VSTPLAARIAQHHGARCEITLTGFKWIVSRALQLVREQGARFVMGFEEALGYCVGEMVHDKDGISAAAQLVRMTAWHAARGCTLYQALEQLYRLHGLHDSRQSSIALRGDAGIARVRDALARLRATPPERIAGLAVTRAIDLRDPARAGLALPATDLLSFELESRHRITVRPSGTEPKLKIYLDCAAELAADESLRAGRTRLRALSERIASAFTQQAGLA
jgi:phosphomannomutase